MSEQKKMKNLPPLDDEQLDNPSRGEWSSISDLNRVAKYIRVGNDRMQLRDIKSVPHTWGHVLAFEDALKDDKHPGHKDAVGQWRALLAMLALRGSETPLSATIKTRRVLLSEPPRQDRKGRLTEEYRSLRELREDFRSFLEEVVQKEGDVTEIHLLYAHEEGPKDREVLVGMLYQSTIVVPVRDFAGNDKLPHRWASVDSGLVDPLGDSSGNRLTLTPDQCEIARQFVTKLREALQNEDSKIKTQLENFRDRLEDEAKNKIEEWKEAGGRSSFGTDLWKQDGEGGTSAVHAALTTVWEADRPQGVDVCTDLKIAEITLDNEPFRIVLADPQCADSLGKEPELVSVIGGQTTLADLSRKSFEYHCRRAEEHGILLVRPQDLLSGHLVRLEDFKVGTGVGAAREKTTVHPRWFEDKLLPIKPLALLVFDDFTKLTENLRKDGTDTEPEIILNLSVSADRYEKDEKNEFKKVNKCPVLKRNQSSKQHTISRTYRRANRSLDDGGQLVTTLPPSSLAAWPNFRYDENDDAWKWNYLYSSDNYAEGLSRIEPTTGLSKGYLESDMTKTPSEKGRMRLEQWASPDGPLERRGGVGQMEWGRGTGPQGKGASTEDDAANTEKDTEIEWLRIDDELLMRAKWAFDAVLFRLERDHGPVYAGVGILPDAGCVKEDDGIDVHIACDLGSTNTIVYTKQHGKKAQPAELEPRLRRFNNWRGADDDDGYAFMPVDIIRQPFSTVMRKRRAATGETAIAEWSSAGNPELWRDFAFFDPNVGNLTRQRLGRGGGGLVFDVKWGETDDERDRARRYLRHITMLSHADVIGDAVDGDESAPRHQVIWHLSYPISMADAGDYRKKLQKAVDGNVKAGTLKWHTESEAALTYFSTHPGVDKTGTIVVLDIGGGSTDIAIGTMNSGIEGVWPNSVRLAGKDLMTEFLLYNRRFLKVLELDRLVHERGVFGDHYSRRAFMEGVTDFGDAAGDAASAIINSSVFNERFRDRRAGVSGELEMKLLKVGASLMMGGLCYYLGMQIRGLADLKVRQAKGKEKEQQGEWIVSKGEEAKPVFGEEENVLDTVTLCFGGKGATLFKRWESDLEVLRWWLAKGMGEKVDTVKLFFSESMKHEAAEGMLHESGGKVDFKVEGESKMVGRRCDYRVIGVGARLGAVGKKDATTFLHAIENGSGTAKVDADEFWEFAEAVGHDCGFKIHFKKEAKATIVTAGNGALRRLLSSEKKSAADPPFIVMLGTAMKEVYKRRNVEIDWGWSR